MEAVIFIGVQGAGKTSFYLRYFFKTHVRISLDLLRTRHREQTLLTACLTCGQRFVIDNTNPTRADRERYIEPARAAGFRAVAYYFETSLTDASHRNNQRFGRERIPPIGVNATFRKLQRPTIEEGFDTIHTVQLSHDQFLVDRRPAT